MICGQPSSVGSKCVRNSPWGSVRRVPKNTALTAGLSSKYASRAGRMGNEYRFKSRWYCSADLATKSSTSANGWGETMYIACSGRLGTAVFEERGRSMVDCAGRFVATTPGSGVVDWEAHAGKQASIRTKRTKQSLPPLYESES